MAARAFPILYARDVAGLVRFYERLAQGLRSCGIDRTYRKGAKPSDHAPLVCELDV